RVALIAHGLVVKELSRGEREDQPDYQVDLVSLGDRIEQALRSALNVPVGQSIVGRVEFVGPQVGQQLRNQGFLALFYSLVFMLLYVAVRFDLFFAPGAIVALAHDVTITLGVFSVFQFEVNLQVVAAILALVGYSINDTIVVYDRMRENVVRLRGRDLRSLVNTSINETLSRTVLTSGTTLLTVIAMLVFAGGTIREFAIALFVGIIIGTYSSIGIAASLYVFLRERYQGGRVAGEKKVVAA
ncbi:MAG: protein translocase subunit SecF, partial [Myxococcota bacterium]